MFGLGEAKAKISLDISDLMSNADQAEQRMRGLDGAAGGAGKSLTSFGTTMLPLFGLGANNAIELEAALDNVNASLGGVDPSRMQRLSDTIKEIGINSQYSAPEVAAVVDELAKRGFDDNDILNGKMADAVVNLAQATGEGLGPATDGITQAMAMWSEETVGTANAMQDATRITDILTVAANGSAGGVSDVIAGMRNAGPVMASMGVSFEDASGAIAMLTNYGYSGAEAGTKLGRAIQMLAAPTDKAKALMGELGISAFDANGQFIGMPALFDQLQSSMSGMSDEAKAAALKTIFGAEAYDAMAIAAETGSGPLLDITSGMSESGIAAEQAGLRMGNVKMKLQALTEGISTLLGSVIGTMLPVFTFLVDTANKVIDVLARLPEPVKTVVGALMGFTAAYAAVKQFLGVSRLLTGGAGLFGGISVAPILGLAAAFGVLYAAWKTNIFGIQDKAKEFADKVGKAWQSLTKATDRFANGFTRTWNGLRRGGIGMFEAGMKAISTGVKQAAEYLGPFEGVANRIGDALWQAGPIVQTFANYLKSVWQTGDVMNGFLLKLPGGLQGIAEGFGQLVSSAKNVIDAFGDGGILGAFRQLKAELPNIGDVLASVWDGLKDLAGKGAISLKGVAVDIASWAKGKVADLWPRVREWLGDAAVTLGSVAASVIDWARGAVSDVWPKIREWVGDAGIALADAAASVTSWAKGTFADVWPKVKEWVGNAGVSLAGVIVNVSSWAKGVLTNVFSKIAGWIRSGDAEVALEGVVANVSSWAKGTLADVWPKVKEWAGNTGISLANAAVNVTSWAKGTLVDVWPKIKEWVGNTGVSLAGVLVNVGSWAKGAFTNVFSKIAGWVRSGDAQVTLEGIVANVSSWAKGTLVDVMEAVQSWITSDQAKAAAVDLKNVTVNVASWLVGTVADVASAVSEWFKGKVVEVSGIAWSLALDEPTRMFTGLKDAVDTVTGPIMDVYTNLKSMSELHIDLSGMFSGLTGIIHDVEVKLGNLIEKFNSITGKIGIPSIPNPFEDALIEEEWIGSASSVMTMAGRAAADRFGGAFGKPAAPVTADTSEAEGKIDGFIDGVSNESIDFELSDGWYEQAKGYYEDLKGKFIDLNETLMGAGTNVAIGVDSSGNPRELLGDFGEDGISLPVHFTLANGFDPQTLLDNVNDLRINAGLEPITPEQWNAAMPSNMQVPVKPNVDQSAMKGQLDSAKLQTPVTPKLTTTNLDVAVAAKPDTASVGTAMGAMGTMMQGAMAAMGPTLASSASTMGTSISDGLMLTMANMPANTSTMFAGIRTTMTGEMDAARLAATASASSMRDAVTSTFASMQGNVSSSATTMRGDATAQASDMNSSVAAQALGMATATALQAGLMQAAMTSQSQTMKDNTSSATTAMKASIVGSLVALAAAVGVQGATMKAALTSSVNAMRDAAVAGAAALATGIRSGLSTASAAIGAAAGSWPGIVASAAGGMASAGYNAGYQAGMGVASGLNAASWAVAAAAANIIATVDNALARAAQIASPSKLMRDHIGINLGLGVATGLDGSQRSVATSAQKVMDAAYRAMTPKQVPYIQPNVSPAGSGRYGYTASPPTIINNYQTDVHTMTSAEWEAYKRDARRGSAAADTLSSPNGLTAYLGGK